MKKFLIALLILGKTMGDRIREPFWFLLYMIPYFTIGWDILLRAFKGIVRGQVFDENFLMAIATVGAIALAIYSVGKLSKKKK